MQIKIKKIHHGVKLPQYAHGSSEDAGMDLCAVEDAILLPGVPTLVSTGLAVELPPGYEAQLRPRSGLALKHGITIPNAPATIDPGYRGEIKVILLWGGHAPNAITIDDGHVVDFDGSKIPWNCDRDSQCRYRVSAGDRIAQMIVARYEAVEWLEHEEMAESTRGAGGFGSSGK